MHVTYVCKCGRVGGRRGVCVRVRACVALCVVYEFVSKQTQ